MCRFSLPGPAVGGEGPCPEVSERSLNNEYDHSNGNAYQITRDTKGVVFGESRKSPTTELFEVDSGRISIRHCGMLKSITLNVLAESQG
ncbi:hypothetical protein Tco_1087162 [Tanacetum coccineum]